ncbi:TIGR01906 family membrane protein [Candidatus Stoquefichus massiliensis]|uniref:TIGR01906 family membrane protein n=1 Tax=Candidatus Stoquefichus massiliensis TaxID=1470350 RepID=UPI0004896ED1|nr:TIGR01906 family membrane protein [Candidatus Stoquefichus massiliensis]
MNRKKDIVLALLLTICIICLAVIVTVFFKQLYYFDIDYLHIAKNTGLSKEVIKQNYDILIQYQSIFYQGTLNMPNFVMSTTGRIHFEEVKRVFEVIQITFVVTGVISGIMIYQNLKQKEYRFLQLTSFFSVGIPAILGFFVALDFDKAFVIFHNIVFRNNYWIFDYTTDPVITILPESFFMHCFMMIIIIVIVISVIMYWIYKKKRIVILESVVN